MALNALLIDPQRVWQGVWRWFDDSMLDCCQSLDVTREKGIVMSKLACLARCNGANAELVYAGSHEKNTFERFLADGFGFRAATHRQGEFRAFMIKTHSDS